MSRQAESLALSRMLRVAAAVLDVPLAAVLARDGAELEVRASLPERTDAAPRIPLKRVKLDARRVWSPASRTPAPAELVGLAGEGRVGCSVSIPLTNTHGDTIGLLVLADPKPRTDLERRFAALDEVRTLLEEALTPKPLRGAALSMMPPPGSTVAPPTSLPSPPPPRGKDDPPSGERRIGGEDPVTGLPDRILVLEEAERRIERAAQTGAKVAAIIVALDRFRRVNEALGQSVGDALLRQVGERTAQSIGDIDIAGRRTGDELIVLLDDLGPLRSAMPVADRILQAIREPFHIHGNEIALTASLGMASFPDDAEDAASLFRCADIALAQAKKSGKGRLVVFNRAMQESVRERSEIEAELRVALRESQLELFYQPKYAIGKRRMVVGAEALVRWRHPKRGLVSPGRFIPVAEETGLIVPLGTWALNEACRQKRAWRERNIPVGRISVNVSALQFARPDFVGTVVRAMRSNGIGAGELELELTESIVMNDFDHVAARLAEVRKHGIRVSIDDFGTGYSSLQYLQRLPIDVLKMDRSFVMGLDAKSPQVEQARMLARVITDLGHGLGLHVLAEGVETEGQLEQLEKMGCDEVQGYLLGKPLPVAELDAHVTSQR